MTRRHAPNATDPFARPVWLVDLPPAPAELGGAQSNLPFDGGSLMRLIHGRPENRNATAICECLGEGATEPMRMLRWSLAKHSPGPYGR